MYALGIIDCLLNKAKVRLLLLRGYFSTMTTAMANMHVAPTSESRLDVHDVTGWCEGWSVVHRRFYKYLATKD